MTPLEKSEVKISPAFAVMPGKDRQEARVNRRRALRPFGFFVGLFFMSGRWRSVLWEEGGI
jgi:hypothetical protein